MTEFILEFIMTFAILIRDYILRVCVCVYNFRFFFYFLGESL